MFHGISYPRGLSTQVFLYTVRNFLSFGFLQANLTASRNTLAHPKTFTLVEPATLQSVFRLLRHFTQIARVISWLKMFERV